MSKGEELRKLLDEAEGIQQQMDAIFTRYNVNFLNLIDLPKEGKDEWDKLLKQKDDITTKIGRLFKNK